MDTLDSSKNDFDQEKNLLTRFRSRLSQNKYFQKVSVIVQKKHFLLILGVCVGISCIAGLFFIRYLHSTRTSKTDNLNAVIKAAQDVNYFSIVSMSPADQSADNASDTLIKITFSEPVRPNSLRSFFTVSPMIPGDFSQGDNPNELVFKAKYPFGSGTSVRVILNKGFESIAGHKFTSDYTYSFSTKIPNDAVVFGNNGMDSRWVNLPVGKSTVFNMQVGEGIGADTTVTIYKGTFDRIVSSLLYSNEKHSDSSYITQNYIGYPVDTKSMAKVSVVKNIQDGSDFTFNQPEGLYYVEAKSGADVVGSTWVSVNDEGLIVRQDDQKVTIATQNIKTGDINSNIKVYLYNLQDKPTLLQVANIQSYGEIPIAYPQKVDLVVAETASGVILAPLTVPETQADIRVTSNLTNLDKIYLQTDKPTYKTQDTVRFNGILRQDNDAKYALPPSNSKVRVWIADANTPAKKFAEQTVAVSDDGVFSGQIILPAELIPTEDNSTLSLTLYAKEESDGAMYLSSKSYTTFDVISQSSSSLIKVSFDKDTYTKGEDVTAHVSVVDSLGNPLANKEMTYTVYAKDYDATDPESVATFGNEWGEQTKVVDQSVTLDENGKADIKLDKLDGNVSQAVTLEASIDADGSKTYGAKTILIQQGKIVLLFGSSKQQYHSGDTTITRVYAHDLTGNSVPNLDLNYQVYYSKYDSDSKSYQETNLSEGTAKTDANGFALIKQPVELDKTSDVWNVTIRVTAEDSDQNTVQAERTIDILGDNNQPSSIYYHDSTLTNFDVATDKLSYNVGDTANLVINSPFDQNVLVTYESGRIYHNEWLKLNKGDNNYKINISSELFPSFTVVFSYFNNEVLYTEGVRLNVSDASKNLLITTNSDKNIYVKNDQAQLTITTKDNTGKPVSANVAVNVMDDTIFNLRNNLPSGSLYWNFYAPRTDKTNFSASTLGIGTGGGCGGGSGTDILYVPNRLGTSYYWNPNLKTDENGEVKVTVPVASASGALRVFVTAADGSSAVGQSQSEILVQ